MDWEKVERYLQIANVYGQLMTEYLQKARNLVEEGVKSEPENKGIDWNGPYY